MMTKNQSLERRQSEDVSADLYEDIQSRFDTKNVKVEVTINRTKGKSNVL